MTSGRFVVVTCLVLTVASFEAVVDREDGSCLFQKTVALSMQNEGENSCECVPFAEAYSQHGVICGQGLEFYQFWAATNTTGAMAATDPALASFVSNPVLNGQVCEHFFSKVKSDVCMNIKEKVTQEEATEWYGSQWCYVGAGCKELNGGAAVPGTSLNWKSCKEGEDKVTSSMIPQKLIKMSKEDDLNLQTLIGHSYAYLDRSTKAPEVGQMNTGATAEDNEKQAILTEELKKTAFADLVKSPRPAMLFPSKDNFQQKWVQFGKQRWRLMYSNPIYVGTPQDMIPDGQQLLAMCTEPAPGEVAGCEHEYYQSMGHTSPWGDKPTAPPARPASFAQKNSAGEKACECLPWMGVYKSERVECGQGLELPILTGKKADISKPLSPEEKDKVIAEFDKDTLVNFDDEYCAGFFSRINASICMNQQYRATSSDADTGSWCYVDASCQKLNGGAVVPGTSLSVKSCKAGEDLQMREMKASKLIPFALDHDVSPAIASGFSHITVNKDVTQESEAGFKQIAASGVPTVVTDLKNPWADQLLITGEETYHLEAKKFLVTGMVPKSQMYRRHYFTSKCLAGCSKFERTTLKEELAKQSHI